MTVGVLTTVSVQLLLTFLVKELGGPGGDRARPRWARPCHLKGPALRKPSLRVSNPWNPEIRDEERALAGVGNAMRPVARTQDLSEGPIVTLREHFVPHSFIH